MASAIEDAGFEIRDTILWVHGQGFPKSLNVAKSIDRIDRGVTAWGGGDPESPNHRLYEGMEGNGYRTAKGMFNTRADKAAAREFVRQKKWQQGYSGNSEMVPSASPEARQWTGWHSNLKPAVEPIVLARKPVEGSIARNVLQHRTGALNIDACRVPGKNTSIARRDVARRSGNSPGSPGKSDPDKIVNRISHEVYCGDHPGEEIGRYPANFIHDGSDAVTGSLGHAAPFFYAAQATPKERRGSNHPTVKPLALMRYLVRLITPPGGTVLDPFAGTGTTGEAAAREGFDCILIERDPAYVAHIRARLAINAAAERPVMEAAD